MWALVMCYEPLDSQSSMSQTVRPPCKYKEKEVLISVPGYQKTQRGSGVEKHKHSNSR